MAASRIDLSTLTWTLEGWRQWEWELVSAAETTVRRACDVGPVPVSFPGSVRGALVAAGIVPDPGDALRSRESEFIENRHWIYRATLPASLPAGPLRLVFESLDGPCQVWVNGRRYAESTNAHLPLVVELGDAADFAGAALCLAFVTLPDELGQIGRTSRIRAFKPRFNYGWDWIPRIVQIGPARPARAEVGADRVSGLRVRTAFEPSGRRGRGRVVVGGTAHPGDAVDIRLTAPGGEVVASGRALAGESGEFEGAVSAEVESWWHTGTRYEVVVAGGEEERRIRVGFRRVEWRHTAGAGASAEPWLLHVDGRPVFLRGVNWVPLRADYADVPVEEYRRRLETYARLGVNFIRVWGGGSRERDEFYDLCDELGLLVWQELPLSSSGLDNRPPDDEEFAAGLAAIATQYARSLHHHPCLLVWGGGNELYEPDAGSGTPLTFAHPALRAAREAILAIDPDHKIVPTSPSGPCFAADDPDEFGTGVHEDVHGPWVPSVDLDAWRAYWARDDAMLRSEVGVAGASGLDLLERHGLAGTCREDRFELWRHTSNWWIERSDIPDGPLAEWVSASQQAQAEALRIAAASAMDRFPACGGFVVWLGHDAFPCAVSLSLLDYDGRPKPVADALATVFTRVLPGE